MSSFQASARHFHFLCAVILAVALVPLAHHAHLPLHFTWGLYFTTFYVVQFLESLILALVLGVVGYRAELWRAISHRGAKENPLPALASIILPATYLFCVFILIFSYNDLIAIFRFDGMMDAVQNRVDSWLMGGWTVADLSRHVGARAFSWLLAIYLGMFAQVGACLLIVALREGRGRAWQFVGAIATAYFIGLACFYFLPVTGPYYLANLNPHHGGYIGGAESRLAGMLAAIAAHRELPGVGLDYFVGFPCLHITQPLIVLWFLRKSRGAVALLASYDVIMIAAILLLQQHYLVDLVGGVCVAILAVAISDLSSAKISRGGENPKWKSCRFKPMNEYCARNGQVEKAG